MRSSAITSTVQKISSTPSRRLIPVRHIYKPPKQQTRNMASSPLPFKYGTNILLSTPIAGSDLGIENTNIKAASGVTLDEHQKTLVGSVLDVSLVHPCTQDPS